jgi:phosphate transport system substrate-binding protein
VSRILRIAFVLVSTLAVLLPAALNGQESTVLVVTGSSMPEPLYLMWNDEYHKQQPAVKLRYLPEGSGAGAERVLTGAGDFGGGDAPIPEKELKTASSKVVELPTVLIGIVIIYNVPGASGSLRLSGPALANIFLGKITLWNDPALVKLNPDAKLQEIPIRVVHRTAGKGSSYILSDFLSKASPEFLSRIGRSESPNWVLGASAGRTQDMVDKVQSAPGAIGYTELNIAEKASLHMASIRNDEGEYIHPSARSIAAAAKAAIIANERAWKRKLSDQQLYLVLRARGCARLTKRPGGGSVPEMGVQRRAEDGAGRGLSSVTRRTPCKGVGKSGDNSLNANQKL